MHHLPQKSRRKAPLVHEVEDHLNELLMRVRPRLNIFYDQDAGETSTKRTAFLYC